MKATDIMHPEDQKAIGALKKMTIALYRYQA